MGPISLKKNWEDGMVLDKNLLNADATAIEAVINKLLTSVTDSDSGGDAVKMTPISGVGNSGTDTVQKVAESLKVLIDGLVVAIQNTTLGQILDGTISAAKLAFDPATQAELDALSGTGNSHTVKEAYDLASAAQIISLLTTAGDMLGRDSEMLVRIAKGTAYQNLGMNSGATAQQYMASLQSLITAAGDLIYGSAANTPARLALGSQDLAVMNKNGALAYGIPLSGRYSAGGPLILSRVSENNQFYDGNGSYYRVFGTFALKFNGRVSVTCEAWNNGGSVIRIVGGTSGAISSSQSANQGETSTNWQTVTIGSTDKDFIAGESIQVQMQGSAGLSGGIRNINVYATENTPSNYIY